MLILISDAFDPSLPNKLKQFGEVADDHTRLPEALWQNLVFDRDGQYCGRGSQTG